MIQEHMPTCSLIQSRDFSRIADLNESIPSYANIPLALTWQCLKYYRICLSNSFEKPSANFSHLQCSYIWVVVGCFSSALKWFQHGYVDKKTEGRRISEKKSCRPIEGLVRTGIKMGVAWNRSYSYTAHHFFWEKQFENLLCELGSMKTPNQFQSDRILLDWSYIPSFHGSLHFQTIVFCLPVTNISLCSGL